MLRDYSTSELIALAKGLGANSYYKGCEADPYCDEDLVELMSELPENGFVEKKIVKSWLEGYAEAKS